MRPNRITGEKCWVTTQGYQNRKPCYCSSSCCRVWELRDPGLPERQCGSHQMKHRTRPFLICLERLYPHQMVTRNMEPLNVAFPHNLSPLAVASTEEGCPQTIVLSGCAFARGVAGRAFISGAEFVHLAEMLLT